MIQEFEGKTEKEAVDNAIATLGLSRDEIDVEVIESKSGFLFGGKVKIRVHMTDVRHEARALVPNTEIEKKLVEFLGGVIAKMSIKGEVSINYKEENKIVLDIKSDDTSILIGRKGKNIDALQLIMNVYTNRLAANGLKVIVDAESYRDRRQSSLMRLARKTAEQVRRSRRSVLLQAMNPFERRIIHTTLSDMEDVQTISEGDGLFKKVRIFYKE